MSEPPAHSPESEQPAVPAPAAPAPLDLTPPAARRERLAWYGGAMLLSLILATLGMQLWNRDLRAPFYYDLDALLYLPLTRTVVEQGFWSHWHTERMGAPGAQELYDFPIIDYLHFAILWLIGRVIPDVLLVYNIYSLLTYPLIVLTAMWVLRWLKLSLPGAAVAALLYAFLPYHQERYHYHYFLAAYWWVPVSLVPALAICHGNFPFFRRGPDGRYPPVSIDWRVVWENLRGAIRGSRAAWKAVLAWAWRATRVGLREGLTLSSLGWIALGAVTASAGAYYAFFACATYAFAGVYGWVLHRSWRAAMSAGLVIAPVVVVGFVYHIPTYAYHHKYGTNAITTRFPEEADSYGLKLAHLLLPANDHNFRPFANIRTRYGTPDRPGEGEKAGSFGLIGGAGLIALVGMAMLPSRRRWPEGAFSALTLYLVFLSTTGALGSIFNFLVTPQIRAYNRISVFIGFLCLFMVFWWLDRFLLTRTGRRMRQARYPILALVLIFGFFDQTPWGWNPLNPKGMDKVDLMAERFRADKRFFKQIEESIPPGSKVFCLPYSAFPESPPVHKMPAYEHARGYIMTDTLYWSFGSIKGREADAWCKDVAHAKPDEMLRRVVARGFDGLLIDGRGFPTLRDVDAAAALINRLNELYRNLAGPRAGYLPQIVHEDKRQFFLDLRPYRDAYQRIDPVGFARSAVQEAEWVAPLWLGGFFPSDSPEDGERLYWGPYNAQLVLVNPADRTRRFELTFTLGVTVPGPFDISIGGPINDSFAVDRIPDRAGPGGGKLLGDEHTYTLDLSPGRTVIPIRCRVPEHFLPHDARNLCYFIKDFRLVER